MKKHLRENMTGSDSLVGGAHQVTNTVPGTKVPGTKLEDKTPGHGRHVQEPLCKDVPGSGQLHNTSQQSLLRLMIQSKYLDKDVEETISRYIIPQMSMMNPVSLKEFCKHKLDDPDSITTKIDDDHSDTVGDLRDLLKGQNKYKARKNVYQDTGFQGDTAVLLAYSGDNESADDDSDDARQRAEMRKYRTRSRSKRRKDKVNIVNDNAVEKANGNLEKNEADIPYLKELSFSAFDEKKGHMLPSRRLELVYRRDRRRNAPSRRRNNEQIAVATVLIDTLSRNNNHPGNADDVEPKCQPEVSVLSEKPYDASKCKCASNAASVVFRFAGAEQQHTDTGSTVTSITTDMEHITITKKKEYFLVPIGGSSKTTAKWTDVASIINQGTFVHKNLNSQKSHKYEAHTTLDNGIFTFEMSRRKQYAVKPCKQNMVSLERLLEVNANRRIFTETHAKFVCVNLMMALRFLHEHNILHGSLSPKKVLFTEIGYPYLTGFGSACIMEDRQTRPREKWLLEYSSPDQLYQTFLTEDTDIFSLGQMIYAMIYGTPPHKGEDDAATRKNILGKQFQPPFAPEAISAQGRKLIMKCIRKNERRRFSIIDKKDLFASVPWFAGLKEERLYKQTVVSPMIGPMKKCAE